MHAAQAAEALGRWEADRPNLLHFIAALTETRGIMRAEVARLQDVIAGVRSARQAVSGGATTGFNVIQVLMRVGPTVNPSWLKQPMIMTTASYCNLSTDHSRCDGI